MSHSNTLDVDSIIERLLSVRGQPNNRTVQLAEGEIRALCASARGTVEFEFVFFFVFAQRLLKGKARKSTHHVRGEKFRDRARVNLGSVTTSCE